MMSTYLCKIRLSTALLVIFVTHLIQIRYPETFKIPTVETDRQDVETV